MKNDEWIFFNRLDGYAEELDSNFDNEKHNIPKYSSLEELEEILKETFKLYQDFTFSLAEHLDTE